MRPSLRSLPALSLVPSSRRPAVQPIQIRPAESIAAPLTRELKPAHPNSAAEPRKSRPSGVVIEQSWVGTSFNATRAVWTVLEVSSQYFSSIAEVPARRTT